MARLETGVAGATTTEINFQIFGKKFACHYEKRIKKQAICQNFGV